MRNSKKVDEQFYRRLSRKDLQCLCKTYGLPANKSSSEMAKSLASHFQDKNSMSSRKRLGETQEASLPTSMITGLLPGAPFHSSKPAGKDNNGFRSCSISQTVRGNEVGRCVGNKAYDKGGVGCSKYCFQETSNSPFPSLCGKNASHAKECPPTILCKNSSGITRDGMMEDMCPVQHIDVNFCSHPKENASSSSIKTFKTDSSCSFEFYVHSEEGINLWVDLNSKPSDWIKKLKSEVNIRENICPDKSPSFHEELERFGESNKQIKSSFLWSIGAHKSKNHGNMQSESSPSVLIKENEHVVLDHLDGVDGSLTSSAIKPSAIAGLASKHVQEDQGVIVSEPNSDVRDGFQFCSDENGYVTALDLDFVNTSNKVLAGNSIVDTSDCPISLASFAQQNSKASDEIFGYSTQENSCSLVNSRLVMAECLAGISAEISLPEAETEQNESCMPCQTEEFLDLVYPTNNTETEQSGLANSSEPDLDICGNHLPTSVEELERSKVIDGMEGSESSPFDESFEKTSSSLDNREPNGECLKKRPRLENDDQNHGRSDAKILRSVKHIAGKVLPRRSTRLVSKGYIE